MRAMIMAVLLLCPLSLSAQTITKMVDDMAVSLHKSTAMRVAIMPFEYSDGRKDSPGPSIVQERITTIIVNRRIAVVVERTFLDRVLTELRLQSTGIMDDSTIKELGRVLGADAVIVGMLNDTEHGRTEINARIVNTETAEIIGAGTADIKKVWEPRAEKPRRIAVPKAESGDATGYMNARLAELNGEIGRSIKPQPDGTITMNGVNMTSEQFSEAALSAVMQDTKAAGYKLPKELEHGDYSIRK